MKKKLSLVMIALMAIAAFAGLRRAAEPVTLTWDFSEDVFANADNPDVKDTLEIGAEGYDYRGMILHMLFTKNSGGKDYVTKKYGFRPNGSSSTSNRYIQYTPEYDGQLKVYYASNNTSATDRIVAVGTAIKTFKQAAITSSEVPTEVVAYGLTDGGTVLNFDANLTKGTTYYIYMAEGGSRITKLEFTYTPAEEEEPAGEETSYSITFKDNGVGQGDGNAEKSTVADLIANGADYVSAISDASKVYLGKEGYGIKLSSSKADGSFTMTLANAVKPTKIVVNAAAWVNSQATVDAAKIAINGADAQSITQEFANYTFNFDGNTEINSITIAATKRAYVTSVTVYYMKAAEPVNPIKKVQLAGPFSSWGLP